MAEDLDLGGSQALQMAAVSSREHSRAMTTRSQPVPIDLVGAAGGKDAHLSAGVKGEVRQGLPQQGK